ncbi:MAG TPA: 5-oxoprolinase subunit PxpB [Opitutaceae bacterium]|nr:5-oxoprolinase subunit PxpB [Opitutaceae bacterium]
MTDISLDERMQCVPLGDASLLIEVDSEINSTTTRKVMRLAEALSRHRLPGVYDIVPAFTTVGVHFDPVQVGGHDPFGRVETWVQQTEFDAESTRVEEVRSWEIPVIYGGEAGPDLEAWARHVGMSPAEAVGLHCDTVFTVGAVGFSPGFPYLLGLPEQLMMPRRATPRVAVPAGSVAIGGRFTGIYPSTTPGGWNLIGQTTDVFFNARAEPPARLRVGDQVRFLKVTI